MARFKSSPLWLLLSICTMLGMACGGSATIAGGPGFTEAFFDAAKLKAIMADATCTKVRFYNVRRNATDAIGSAMMIAIRSDSTEIYDGARWKYRTYDKMSGSETSTLDLLKPAAIAACQDIKDDGYDSFCGEFTKLEISSMLAGAGCNGIRIAPALTAGSLNTMKMWPVKINSGRATILPAPDPKLCTEPCPSFCGPKANYVHL